MQSAHQGPIVNCGGRGLVMEAPEVRKIVVFNGVCYTKTKCQFPGSCWHSHPAMDKLPKMVVLQHAENETKCQLSWWFYARGVRRAALAVRIIN